ncbi:hypothetical protein BAE44_0015699 [Dichanthelium oligosanthes]|uniref:F-box domain-containing protein n=1 Tax=Dichanthelium oligosanthes TaxID=888268 RepID=A0A1E5VDQ8_9POAL|nr:hypothetical protein BAE44_0015699 [Dichanthelium oligosanthes]
MVMVSPLHRAIDAGRWGAERVLGRLIIVVHAAFLDAGFVPVRHRSRRPGPVPRQAGRTASALSLRNGVALEPTFMSLPGDVKVAILPRLTSGTDLASVEWVCTGLRHLVAEHDCQLWKPRYNTLVLRRASWLLPNWCHLPETRWKERYVTAMWQNRPN